MPKLVEKHTDVIIASAGSLYSMGTVPEMTLRYVPGILTILYVLIKIVIAIRRERDRTADRKAQESIIRNAHRKPVEQEEED